MAGPERPAVTLEIMGRRRWTSTLIPTKVLTRVMASAPASWQARAKMRMSVTLGESFTQTGLAETRVTACTTWKVRSGSCPNSIPPSEMLGQEMFNSSALTLGQGLSRSVRAVNSPMLLPKMLAMTWVS